MKTIRPVAICVFRREGRILVSRDSTPDTHENFFRPFGGGIDFGEPAIDAVIREIDEELGEATSTPVLLGVLENRFVFAGKPHHEHVFVFDAVFENSELYGRQSIIGKESNGQLLHGEWVRPSECETAGIPLYPDGLLELLQSAD